ncbi:MAG TPA: hypothetical protein VM451_00860 [Candidatus Limnocylindria bacterium]|nr:hypothetical protein [Candidatus Limnocylindria bacterium]
MAERAKSSNGSAGGARPRRTRTAGSASATESAPKVVILDPVAPGVVEDAAALGAEDVELRLGAVGRVETGRLELSRGAVGAARAEVVTVDQGAIGAALADRVEVSRGYARSIIARQAQMDRAAARVVIAANVTADRSAVMFLVARKVEGNVRVLFDWRGAIAFGAVAGLFFAVLGRRRGGKQRG